MNKKRIAWIGGDNRQLFANDFMKNSGYRSHIHSDINMIDADIIVLPMPLTRDGVYLNAEKKLKLSELETILPKKCLVLGGNLPESFRKILDERSIRHIEYYTEEFQIENALPTAEGAIAVAICEMPIVLSGANATIIGYGRIGKILAAKLQALGVNVTVLARKGSDLAMARACGHSIFSIREGLSNAMFSASCHVIFNTAPVQLLGSSEVKWLKKDTLYIELASAPGGIDAEAAEKHGIRVLPAQSLPGKYSPATAGKILAETVVQILQTEGIEL